jgi:hypothetical protein
VKDLASSYDLIRPHQHIRRDRQANLLRCFEVDDELELLWLLDRKIGGLSAVSDFIHVKIAARR